MCCTFSNYCFCKLQQDHNSMDKSRKKQLKLNDFGFDRSFDVCNY